MYIELHIKNACLTVSVLLVQHAVYNRSTTNQMSTANARNSECMEHRKHAANPTTSCSTVWRTTSTANRSSGVRVLTHAPRELRTCSSCCSLMLINIQELYVTPVSRWQRLTQLRLMIDNHFGFILNKNYNTIVLPS